LNLNGLIPLTATGGSLPANWREKWRWRYEVFKPSAEQRFWVSPNRPPTWLHYRGESLPWVRSIGFAGLILNELPSEQQLGRIREAELGAISPPPTHNVAFDATAAQALKGWSIGSALDARQSEVARRQVQRVTQLPSELRRPLVGEALEHYWMFSRIADEVILPFPAPLTAGQTAEKIAWAAQNLETTKKRGDGWVSLDVGPNPALVDQLRAAHAIIAPQREFDAVQANPLGLRYQAACAAVAGARGLVFRTFKPLDLQAPGDSATVAALRWIHSDLALWGPWMVSGQTSAAPTLDRPDYTAAAWNVSHSRLVIALVSSPAAQHCLPSTGDQPLQLSLASSATPQQILRVTEGRLQRVEAQATPEGLQWRVERPVPVETFVITSNPLVIDYVRGQLSGGAEQRVADQLEIASYNMGLATQLVEARYPPLEESLFADGDDPLGIRATLRNLAIAQRQLDQGYQAMHSRQAMGAFTLAARASDLIQAVLAEAQQTATSNLATPQASPFVLGPTSLGYHWQLAEACARSEWRPLDLPGAQFQDLQQMLSQGWSLEQRPLEQVDQQVELVPARSSSPPGLRLAAYAQTAHRAGPRALAGGYEGATARVRSSAAAVRRGQLIRISGKARVLRAPTTAESGILLYDNQAGPSLGQLVRGQLGEVVDIELYRFVVADGEFRILAECRGECDIILESLQASVIEPATNRQSFLTFPSE
ncbi:MAG: hypothetical protein KDA45_10125, partial [Planctomycetales bacterium]|nr:hypothetical protein [Planctomycetales bacterium]